MQLFPGLLQLLPESSDADAIQAITQNYRQYHAVRDALTDLQEWARVVTTSLQTGGE